MASTRLQRTVSSTTNTNIWTYSAWFKRGNLNINDALLLGTFSTDFELIRINSSNQLYYLLAVGGTGYSKITSQVFRDTSAWFHLVISRNGSTVNIYVNGELVTDYATNETFPTTGYFNTASRTVTVGGRSDNTNYFDGSMTHVHFIDGTVYDASAFGETDATTGIWKAKTAPSVTYGTNGFFLKFENSGSMGTDSSGNANNFTVNGTMTQTIDTPSNVFTTWNGILSYGSTMSLANGNTTANTSSLHEAGKYLSHFTSLGMTAGKYYAEFKITSNANQSVIGISSNLEDDVLGSTSSAYNFIYKGNGWGYYGSNGNVFHTNSSTQLSYGNSLANNDILGVALDLDNLKLYFSKNGVWQNSADPVAGTGDVVSAGAKALNGSGSTGTYYFCCADFDQSTVCNVQANFGNGYFGTTAVASAQNPDDGIGIFEFSPPTGYKALCTKSLNSQEYD